MSLNHGNERPEERLKKAYNGQESLLVRQGKSRFFREIEFLEAAGAFGGGNNEINIAGDIRGFGGGIVSNWLL